MYYFINVPDPNGDGFTAYDVSTEERADIARKAMQDARMFEARVCSGDPRTGGVPVSTMKMRMPWDEPND